MSYYFNKTLNLTFDKAIAGVTEELSRLRQQFNTEANVPTVKSKS